MSTTIRDREDPTLARLLKHMAAVRDLWPQVVQIKWALQHDQRELFLEAWRSLDFEQQTSLHVSTRSGGIWTVPEKKLLRDWDFSQREALPRAATASPTAGGAGSEED